MTLIDAYRKRVASGQLAVDAQQENLVQQLDGLSRVLNAGLPRRSGIFGWLFAKPVEQPRGLYIFGEVGRGKTMLMDMFFESVSGWPKRRVHFHAFMQEVHRRRAAGGDDVIGRIAGELAEQAKLLCIDEMQIVDIADAMIVGRLYDALHERDVVLVTTSNLPPDGLYKDGLNRQLFLPFVARLKETMDVVSLNSERDYRLGRVMARQTFHSPPSAENRVAFNRLWHDLTDGAMGRAETIEVLGRKLTVPKAAHGCASFTFYELCGEALGTADYLAIAKTYRTVFISGVPRLKVAQRNECKRLILMIDTFYDAHTKLVALAEDVPEKLFPKNQHVQESKRAVSRLQEMQAMSWWQDGKT
jgi:cell division protein ZapE